MEKENGRYPDNRNRKMVNLGDVADHLSMSKDAVRLGGGKLPAYNRKMYKLKLEVFDPVREGQSKSEIGVKNEKNAL